MCVLSRYLPLQLEGSSGCSFGYNDCDSLLGDCLCCADLGPSDLQINFTNTKVSLTSSNTKKMYTVLLCICIAYKFRTRERYPLIVSIQNM